MKIGIIGLGNMGSAILTGLLKDATLEIFVTSKEENTEERAKALGVHFTQTAKELIQSVDICILAVKPNVYPHVLEEICEALKKKNVLLISIAAGVFIQQIEQWTHPQQKIVRIMPNLTARIGKSSTAITKNDGVDEIAFAQAKKICQSFGNVYEIEEKDFSTFIALAGSAPAYVYMFIDAMSRGAVKHGMNKQLALEIFTDTLIASGLLLLEEKENPWQLIDNISSPGGTTVAGVLALEEAGFVHDVIKGFDATVKKDQEIASTKCSVQS